MLRVAGFDPGINASACVLEGGQILDAWDLPTLGDGTKREIDVRALGAWLEDMQPSVAIIENVQAMPSIPGADGIRRGMGAASAFRFGLAVGQIRGVVAAYEIPIHLVVPGVWKKHFGLKGPDKENSRQLAIRRWPAAAHLMARKMDHGRAEAALIAAYGVERKLNAGSD